MYTVTPHLDSPSTAAAQSRHHGAGVPACRGPVPHVASGQWLVVGEDDGVVLGVGLVAALPDPAAVVCGPAVEAPVVDAERRVTARGTLRPLQESLPRSSGTPKPWELSLLACMPPRPSGTGTTRGAGPQAGVMLGEPYPHPTGEPPRSSDLLVEAYIGVFQSLVSRCDRAPLSPWGPLGGNKGEDETPQRHGGLSGDP